jgi:hypothetical protein
VTCEECGGGWFRNLFHRSKSCETPACNGTPACTSTPACNGK